MITPAQDTLPQTWRDILALSEAHGFDMPSDGVTGGLLRMLAASRPGGRLLELGTGTGLGAACLLAGMDASANLVTVDTDSQVQAIARSVLGEDPRIDILTADGLDFLRAEPAAAYDLIFADAMPGKYEGLDDALARLRPGGLYVVDDLLPQPNRPPGHQTRVDGLIARLTSDPSLATSVLPVGTGHVVAARLAA